MKTLQTRTVKIYPKASQAGTQYYDLDRSDEEYIYHWLQRLLADITEESTYDEELRRDWFRRRPQDYPKGRNGPNSHASIIAGIVSAKLANPKKNISELQLSAIEQMFVLISQFYQDDPEQPKSIRFQKTLFTDS